MLKVTIKSNTLDDEIILEAETLREIMEIFIINCDLQWWSTNEITIID